LVNILLIITPFKPAQTPNTIRWAAIIKEFIESGNKVTILTSNWTSRDSIEKIDDANIYRTGHNTLLDFLYTKIGKTKRRNISSEYKQKKPSRIIAGIEVLVDKFWRHRYWPDGSVLFLKSGKKKIAEIIEKEKISHVISVGLPFTCHLIAQEAKIIKPDLHWIMDVQDPFSISNLFWVNNFSKYAVKNIEAEERCLSLADKVIFTNDKVKELYSDLFETQISKFYVIPPILNIPSNENTNSGSDKPMLKLNPNKKHIAYFGSFYQGVRSPLRFLKFLDYLYNNNKSALDNMEFHFYGEMNKFSKPIFLLFDHLNEYIHHHGFVKHNDLNNHIVKFDLLLNFGNITNYHLPSKVVEFLYYNKPLINVISIDDDSAKLFLKDKIEILNLKIESQILKSGANNFIDFIMKVRDVKTLRPTNLNLYLPAHLANSYLTLMKSSQ